MSHAKIESMTEPKSEPKAEAKAEIEADIKSDVAPQTLVQSLASYLEQSGLTKVSLIAPLTQGLSNQNYYIRGLHPSKAGEAEWVLRLNSWASSQICNRDDEVANWQLANQGNLAPSMVYVSPDNSFYLSEFFSQNEQHCWNDLISANGSQPITTTHNLWPEAEKKLLELLNGLTQLPPPTNVMSIDNQWQQYLKRLTEMHQQLNRSQMSLASGLNTANKTAEQGRADVALLKRWQHIYHQLIAKSEGVDEMLHRLAGCLLNLQFSHRDLNPNNILVVDDKLKCIDFEYACRSHPLCDLAAVIASHSLSSQQRHWLISNYLLGHPNLNNYAKDAVVSAVDLYWVFAVCWALQMAFDHLVKDGCMVSLQVSGTSSVVEDYLNCAEQYHELIASC
ncbi:phosphotransferase [Shewanella sp. 125m-7]